MLFLGFRFCLLNLSTCLTGWVYDQELGLYRVNRVEALLLNQIPCGSLICTALVDFICWNCVFDILICLFLDLDSRSAQFFQTRLQQFCIWIIISAGQIFQNHKLCKDFGLVSVLVVS